MPVERHPTGTSLIDVLDRVLDKGIVIDAWVRVALVGIDLITVEARVIVSSIETYLKYCDLLLAAQTAPLSVRATVPAGTVLGEQRRLEPRSRQSRVRSR
jgi:hypothetical protein